jgi:hypothetical protein
MSGITAHTGSIMVAGPSDDRLLLAQNATAGAFKFATAPVTKFKLAPRRCNGELNLLWHEELVNILAQLGLTAVRGITPTYEQVLREFSRAPSSFDVQAQYESVLHIYQAKNTLMFHVLRGSLDLTGPFERTDLLMLASADYSVGDLRDGWRLYQWVLRFCDTSTIGAQTELRRKVDGAVLKAGANLDLFVTHCTTLLYDWSKLVGNNVSQPASFWHRLLASLPSEPPAAHLTTARNWLVDKVSSDSPLLADPPRLITLLCDHACMLGLHPAGTLGFRPAGAVELIGVVAPPPPKVDKLLSTEMVTDFAAYSLWLDALTAGSSDVTTADAIVICTGETFPSSDIATSAVACPLFDPPPLLMANPFGLLASSTTSPSSLDTAVVAFKLPIAPWLDECCADDDSDCDCLELQDNLGAISLDERRADDDSDYDCLELQDNLEPIFLCAPPPLGVRALHTSTCLRELGEPMETPREDWSGGGPKMENSAHGARWRGSLEGVVRSSDPNDRLVVLQKPRVSSSAPIPVWADTIGVTGDAGTPEVSIPSTYAMSAPHKARRLQQRDAARVTKAAFFLVLADIWKLCDDDSDDSFCLSVSLSHDGVCCCKTQCFDGWCPYSLRDDGRFEATHSSSGGAVEPLVTHASSGGVLCTKVAPLLSLLAEAVSSPATSPERQSGLLGGALRDLTLYCPNTILPSDGAGKVISSVFSPSFYTYLQSLTVHTIVDLADAFQQPDTSHPNLTAYLRPREPTSSSNSHPNLTAYLRPRDPTSSSVAELINTESAITVDYPLVTCDAFELSVVESINAESASGGAWHSNDMQIDMEIAVKIDSELAVEIANKIYSETASDTEEIPAEIAVEIAGSDSLYCSSGALIVLGYYPFDIAPALDYDPFDIAPTLDYEPFDDAPTLGYELKVQFGVEIDTALEAHLGVEIGMGVGFEAQFGTQLTMAQLDGAQLGIEIGMLQ